MLKFHFTFIFFLLATCNSGVVAQSTPELTPQDSLSEPPAFKLFRAEEHYDYLKDKENSIYKEDYLDAIKFIGLNASKNINLGFGGEIRLRMEDFTNRNWADEDETFYSHRIALHSNLNVTKYIRFFGELYHGLVSLEQNQRIHPHQANPVPHDRQ